MKTYQTGNEALFARILRRVLFQISNVPAETNNLLFLVQKLN